MDTATFEALFKTHYVRLHRLAQSLLHDSAESEDVVSEVFATVWKNQPDIAAGKWPDYLARATYNHCLNALNRQSRLEEWQAEYRQEQRTALHVEAEEQRQLSEIRHCIRHDLPPRTSQALTLCFGHGLSDREAAEVMEVTEAAINKHIVTGLRMLRERFNGKL